MVHWYGREHDRVGFALAVPNPGLVQSQPWQRLAELTEKKNQPQKQEQQQEPEQQRSKIMSQPFEGTAAQVAAMGRFGGNKAINSFRNQGRKRTSSFQSLEPE